MADLGNLDDKFRQYKQQYGDKAEEMMRKDGLLGDNKQDSTNQQDQNMDRPDQNSAM